MKWKARRLPKPFEERSVIKFALFPTRINDSWLWLEQYVQYQWFSKYGKYWIDDEKRELINSGDER